MRVINTIRPGGAIYRQRTLNEIDGTAIHRFGSNDSSWFDEWGVTPDAAGIRKFFDGHPTYTGGKEPYSFVVHPSGIIEQARPLTDITPHALLAGRFLIGVCFLGDFQVQPPTAAQWNAGLWLCAGLMLRWPKGSMQGHDEIPRGSGDIRKRCPGRYFDMPLFREKVRATAAESAGAGLLSAGIVFS